MKIKDLKFEKHSFFTSGSRAFVLFANGYGASVITGYGSYMTEDAPFEIAVTTHEGAVCYDTPITDDVIGYLTEDAANDILRKISELPPKTGGENLR